MSDHVEAKLTVTAIKPSGKHLSRLALVDHKHTGNVEVPSEEVIFAASETLIEGTPSWKAGKTYQKVVKTYSKAKATGDGAPWHCRISVHKPDEATFDQMWAKLGKDKAKNEMEWVLFRHQLAYHSTETVALRFIPDIHKVTKVKEISATQNIWTLYYKFPPPVSPRVFTELQITRLSESSPRTG